LCHTHEAAKIEVESEKEASSSSFLSYFSCKRQENLVALEVTVKTALLLSFL